MILIIDIHRPSHVRTVSVVLNGAGSRPVQRWISTRKKPEEEEKEEELNLTADKDAQASLLGAKIVKLPGPSISGRRLDRSE